MVKEVFKDYESIIKIKNLDELKKWFSKNWFVFIIGIFIGMIIKWVLIVLLSVGIVYGIYKLMQHQNKNKNERRN